MMGHFLLLQLCEARTTQGVLNLKMGADLSGLSFLFCKFVGAFWHPEFELRRHTS
jgi:hypothetical protein